MNIHWILLLDLHVEKSPLTTKFNNELWERGERDGGKTMVEVGRAFKQLARQGTMVV